MNSTSNRTEGSAGEGGPAAGRALVVRIGALGDVLLTRRLAYTLHLSGLRTTLLAPARHATLLLADPWIDGVLDSESPLMAEAFTGLWPESAGAFDHAFVISSSPGLLEAAGRAARGTTQLSPTPTTQDTAISLQWAEGARAFGQPITGVLPRLETRAADAAFSGATLIHPGSGSPRKNWPIERFVELSLKLGERGHRVVWVRGPAEGTLSEEWEGERLDRPSLSTLAATRSGARVFIGNDSGVSHLAAAVGAPTVALFGPTLAAVWRPDGPRVQVVSTSSGAMEEISVDVALDAMDRAHQKA